MVKTSRPVLRRKRQAVSNILTAMMMALLAIAAAGIGIAYMNNQTRTMTQITSVDVSQSRLYVNPTTGVGDLTLVLTNTGTTTLTIQSGKIGLQGLANITFANQVQIMYRTASGTIAVVARDVTTSDPKLSGVTPQGLVLASQTSATVKFANLAGFSTFISPNMEYAVTIYTTGAEVLTFKIVAETSQ